MGNSGFPDYWPVDEKTVAQVETYSSLLLKWNRKMNLVGVHDRPGVMRLLEDSFSLAEFMGELFPNSPVSFRTLDLGAGAGLPGIPLRMVWECGQYIMVEARQNRAIFLANVLARLKLPNTSVFNGRAEKFFEASQSAADCIISRAFMPWEKLLPFSAPHITPDGYLIVLSRTAPPSMPSDWIVARQKSYNSSLGTRWFWALSKTARAGQGNAGN